MSAATKSLLVLLAFVALIPAQVAVAADATLYELSEEMTVDEQGYRLATSSFQGTAALGTPLCPQILATLLASGDNPVQIRSCTVSGVGSDKVDVATDAAGRPLRPTYGSGKVWGTMAIVVNADNLVDAPEYVVMTGRFQAAMYLTAPAQFSGQKKMAGPSTQRILIADGVFTPESVAGWAPAQLAAGMQAPVEALGLAPSKFSGVFRLPFSVFKGQKEKPREDRSESFYYLSDTDRLIKVRKNETALGYPTVRIEVTFGH